MQLHQKQPKKFKIQRKRRKNRKSFWRTLFGGLLGHTIDDKAYFLNICKKLKLDAFYSKRHTMKL